MKRILSLTLALVMVLGTFAGVFAAEAEVNPAEFLKEVGVLEGADGDLMLDKTLLRRDSVILLSRLMGAEEIAAEFPGAEEILTFEDITDSYYNGYLAWAVSNKLFEGHDEKTFGFNENVTAQDYATVLLRALEHENMDKDENWAKALETAKEEGILAGLEVENKTEITREQMAVMTFNALHATVFGKDITLADKLGIELPVPAVLEVEEVKADNLKEIKVVFNKAVDRDNVEDRDVYTTNAGSIKDAQLVEDNVIILTLEGEMKNKKEYKLDIRGIKDGDSSVNTEFKFTALDNAVPEVVEVVGLGTKAIKVVMSEPVKNVKSSSFAVDGKTYYGSVSVAGREIILRPYGSGFSVGEHKLVVKSLEDYHVFKSVETEMAFEIVEDKDAPEVVDIKGTLERLVVTFNEPVDDATVTKDSLYWGGVKSQKAKNVVRLSANRYAFEFDKEKSLPTYETKVTVKGVKDYSGNEMKEQDIIFQAEIDQTRPEVLEVKVEDEKTIEVRFNKSVFEDDAVKASNYTLTNEDGKAVSFRKPSLSADGRVVTISLYTSLAVNKDYTLKISGIRDNTKLMNTMLPYEEKITAGNYTSPKVLDEGITGVEKDRTIYIPFSKKMDLESVADASNYLIVVGGTNYSLAAINGDVDVIQDGKAVVLTLPEKINKKDVKLFDNGTSLISVIVLGVKDTAGNYLSNQGTPYSVNADKLEVSSVVATDKKTIEVKFKQTIMEAYKNGFKAPVSIDTVSIDGNKVIVKLDGKLASSNPGNLEISKDAVESITGQKLVSGDTFTITDEIKPSLEDVSAINELDKKVVITLEFDEELNSAYGELAIGDLVIKTSTGKIVRPVDQKVTSTIENDKVIVTIEDKEYIVDANGNYFEAYDIEITKPNAIRDGKGNIANATDGIWTAEVFRTSAEDVAKKDRENAIKALELAIKEAEALEELQYTEETWASLQETLTNAKKVDTTNDETKTTEIEDAASALKEAIKSLVTKEESNKEKADEVIVMIEELPAVNELTIDDAQVVNDAKKAYDDLGDLQELISAPVYQKLMEAVAKIKELQGE